jgi:hypothetical protein
MDEHLYITQAGSAVNFYPIFIFFSIKILYLHHYLMAGFHQGIPLQLNISLIYNATTGRMDAMVSELTQRPFVVKVLTNNKHA